MLKNVRLILVLLFCISAVGTSQINPFSRSGKIIKKTYNLRDFSKISLIELDGKTEIEVGDTFKVEVRIREKYLPILAVSKKNKELTIKFNYTKDNNKYINDPRIRVKITCPKLDYVYKQGNSSVKVNLNNQDKFEMSNEGNGSAVLKGIVRTLKIKNDGNGKTDASGLMAEEVKVNSSGNGDVLINASRKAKGKRNGNGKIIQKGKGEKEGFQ